MNKKNKTSSNKNKVKYGIPVLDISKDERDISIQLMRSIFEVQSVSHDMYEMMEFILKFLKDQENETIDFKVDSVGNIYVTKGQAETYPCIVSHIDTAHTIIPDKSFKVLNSDTEFFAINLDSKERTGVGGDDNCGIYCCLDNLIREENIKLAFFVNEEIGCVGSSNANMNFFEDVSFVLQADRQGYKDVAVNIYGEEMFGADFFDYIFQDLDNYRRDLVEGGLTDVYQLAENGLEVAVANFSCGYYNPHTSKEYVVIDELILTSILFRDIIKSAYVNGEFNIFKREIDNNYYGTGYFDKKSTLGSEDDIFSDLGARDFSYIGKYEDKFSLSNTEFVDKHSHLDYHDDQECTYCGQQLVYDKDMNLYFCHNCMDYDYNKQPK